ncbi:LOB domain-containing protein 28 [Cardamine amara subsp. amara]|uniref:LOB domain-containing protein 28 n=1 Tax=Cardamine amara subsp. amara TaxID=228776 RepID=A0ABD1B5X3_CARAN
MDKITTPCAACKYLRRKCTKECVFAPYFPINKQAQYEAVHKVFGASHVATLLNTIPPTHREVAMSSLAFEAQARLVDPIYGCSAIIYHLQCQIKDLQNQIAIAKNELASYNIVPNFVPLPPIAYQQVHHIPMAPVMSNNYEGFLRTQLLLDDEAQRVASNAANARGEDARQ